MYVGDFNVHPIKIQDKKNTKGRGAKISCCMIPYHCGYCLKKKKKNRRKQVLLRLWRKGSPGALWKCNLCNPWGKYRGISKN